MTSARTPARIALRALARIGVRIDARAASRAVAARRYLVARREAR